MSIDDETGGRSPLPVASPESQGVPSSALTRVLERLEREGHDPRAFAVARHGRLLARGWWGPVKPADPMLVYSMSKTFTAIAAGFAIEEGLFGLGTTLAEIFPGAGAGERSRRITIEHALTMTTGHDVDLVEPLITPTAHGPAGLASAVLAHEPACEPGSHFQYNQAASFLVAAAIQERSGDGLARYLGPRLFDRVGIGRRWWSPIGGVDAGFSGLHLTLDDALVLGQLLLDGGRWRGERILPEGWVDLASRRHVDTGGFDGGYGHWAQGYGFQMWRGRHGYRADGAYGQFAIVVPEQDLVIAHLGATLENQSVLEAYWDELLPVLSDRQLPEAPRDYETLRRQLANLAAPLALPVSSQRTTDSGRSAPIASSVELADASPGDGWVLRLGGVEMPVGHGAWRRSRLAVGALAADADLPGVLDVAAAGRISDDGGWVGSVIVLNAPHRMLLRRESGANEVAARWATEPLGPLASEALAIPEWAPPALPSPASGV